MAVNFTVFVCRGKLWNMSPISRSNMSVYPSKILSNKMMDGRQNDRAQTRSLSSFATVWKTILQSSFPFGTAKYLMDNSNFTWDGGDVPSVDESADLLAQYLLLLLPHWGLSLF